MFLQIPKSGDKGLLVIYVCDPGSVCVLCSGGNFSEPRVPSRGYLYSLKGGKKVGMWEGTGEGGISSNSKYLLLFFLFNLLRECYDKCFFVAVVQLFFVGSWVKM